VAAASLIGVLLPLAGDALRRAGVDGDEVSALLDVIAARVARRQTGARWQRHTLVRLEQHLSRDEALRELVARYQHLADTGRPVHEWPVGI
jgi:hypothetical protein